MDWVEQVQTWIAGGSKLVPATLEHATRAQIDAFRLPISRQTQNVSLTPEYDQVWGYVLVANVPDLNPAQRRYLVADKQGRFLNPTPRTKMVQGTTGHLLEFTGPVDLNRVNGTFRTHPGGQRRLRNGERVVRQLEVTELPTSRYRPKVTFPVSMPLDAARVLIDPGTFGTEKPTLLICDPSGRPVVRAYFDFTKGLRHPEFEWELLV